VVGREVVEEAGGDVLLVSLVPGQSTTGLVRRSAASAAPNKRATKPVES
jgi:bifunctional ADP-heptose synthase (sugar kinase/adenylyltransferase)